ncbi:nucleoside-diphosphate-sugar pyrophosphorylase [Paenibacillus hemerocallicola]|uniref:Nucleoside-diphosphate-sugar pyrophosphorylase n=1 Tax=Paenibacillus hemerocallicola TaxID=1172614 RepID=A0A5C4T8U9_9BACL|nr:NDP-sugar synthase [Paenibacillus hemerocallicola]TNJ64817.1 nucleoside-diphosphate-sugar pyrophosphorylase [Paenibacillus hemerocallicola]
MKTAIILAAGSGTKIWPFAEVRPKAMIPVANRPILWHHVELLGGLGFDHIVIVGGSMAEQIRHYFRNDRRVTVLQTQPNLGTAKSLHTARPYVKDSAFLVLYGDTLLDRSDVEEMIARFETGGQEAVALVDPLKEEQPQDWICCTLSEGKLDQIMGHPRRPFTHRFCAFAFADTFWPYAETNSGLFTNVQVGMMPPMEAFLEMSVADYIQDGKEVPAVEVKGLFADLDKPWHILSANQRVAKLQCGCLTGHVLGEGSSIHPSAAIDGFVKMGKCSAIGRNVVIKGNVIVGDHTIIENGAILGGNNIIGDHTYIGNYCQVSAGSVIGHKCIISHCAEINGLTMDVVHLTHYMEFYGIIGSHTDLGAATVCGTLRFDDRYAMHRVKGRREYPKEHANATFMGDYARTGVNAVLMPGCKVGVNSIVGSGVILEEDLPNRTSIYQKQELVRREWGPEQYGW